MNTATTSDVEEELEEEYAALQAELLQLPCLQRDWGWADGTTVSQLSIASAHGPDSGVDVKDATTDVSGTNRLCGDRVQISGHSKEASQSMRVSVESREKVQRNGSDDADMEELARLLGNDSLLDVIVGLASDRGASEGGNNFKGKAVSTERQLEPLND